MKSTIRYAISGACAAILATASPVAAATTSETVRQASDIFNQVPDQLSQKDKQVFSAIYAAISIKNWAEATRLINAAPKGAMASIARAELYLAPGSPKIEAGQLQALLNDAPWLPQAERLTNLASKRGATDLPDRPDIQRLAWRGSQPKRNLPDAADGIGTLRSNIQALIKDDNPQGAEAALNSGASALAAEALTELRYRVAWSYYTENDDTNARRMGETARSGAGDWGAQGDWVFALASWRLGQFKDALTAFDAAARRTSNEELKAAALFWSARAAMACKQPQKVQSLMQDAARHPETFYGLLAGEVLGMEPVAKRMKRANKDEWKALGDEANVKAAIGLASIGQNGLADEALRFQAKIGKPEQHNALARLAGTIGLPQTQLWMGHYAPYGSENDILSRYPLPNWAPSGGWRVDPALVFAHGLQESQFQTSVVSAAGARGLMQVMPGTAQDLARDRGESINSKDLNRPSINLEYGQSYMEKLSRLGSTGGLLPKVIAAYNAGPAPINRWNSEIRDNGDPLLFIESIPYWETRGYVSTILRNYWIYEAEAGKNGGSMTGLAQNLWPTFPNGGRSVAVRENSVQGAAFAAQADNGADIAAR